MATVGRSPSKNPGAPGCGPDGPDLLGRTPRRALWAGPGARRALAAGGPGTVEYALAPGGYVRFGDEWLLVAIPRAPRGPLTLTVTGLERAPLTPGEELRSEDFAPPPANAGDAWRDATEGSPGQVRAALSAALSAAPPPSRDLAAGLSALARGDHGAALAALAGRGPGLTPAGDDVLAGYAAWQHAAGQPVALASPRLSPLGLAYLRCAERGELPEPAARLLAAIRSGDVALARRRARGLRRWGATSGAAILWGFAAA
jgi:Protein of unknown function (DUF2877)